jgi:hypothetical protein
MAKQGRERGQAGGRPAGQVDPPAGAAVLRPRDVPRWLRDWVDNGASDLPDWVPAALRRKASPALALIMRRLGMDAADAYELEEMTAQDVVTARRLGASWALVGLALGLTAEGARSKYGRRIMAEPEDEGEWDEDGAGWPESPLSP